MSQEADRAKELIKQVHQSWCNSKPADVEVFAEYLEVVDSMTNEDEVDLREVRDARWRG